MSLVTTRGDGLFQVHRALAADAENPEQFDQVSKRRFSESSLSYPSTPGALT